VILSNFAINNRTTVLVLLVLILVAGVTSYIAIPRESIPDVKQPFIQITTTFEGRTPDRVVALVTNKIESKLTGLSGLKEIRSVSAEGISFITVEFMPDIKIDDALQRVRDKVDLAKGDDFPLDADEPVLTEINIAEFPIMMINISGDISPVLLERIADRLEEAIEAIPGVLNSDVLGALEREIRLEIDPDRVAMYGLTLKELMELIPGQNVNTSAGGLESGRMKFNVRVPAEVTDPGDIDYFPLTERDGSPIYLRDVGIVRDAFKDELSIARLNGESSISVTVQKRVGANILEIADRVNAILAEARRQAPQGVQFDVTMDQAKQIRRMVQDLENNIITGLILVALVLVLFMGPRTSLIVALAIPLSMLMSFAILELLGITLNMVVLFSLTLALGMLVDNAIVIVENIYRHTQMGMSRIAAAMQGTSEVAWPVIASTATTIAAFTPLLFWPGVVGDFMGYLPTTLIVTLSSSLFVAMIISPVVCSVVGGGKASAKMQEKRHPFIKGYRALLSRALKHRFVTISSAVVALAVVATAYAFSGLGKEFFPKMDPKNALIKIRAPQGTSIYYTDAIARLIEGRLEKYRPDLDFVISNVGASGASFFGEGPSGPHDGTISLVFHDFVDRKRPSMEALKEIRGIVEDIPGVEITVEEEQGGPPTGEPVTIRISGKDFPKLEELSEEVMELIADVPGLVNLRSDLVASKPELSFEPYRGRANLVGVNSQMIGLYLQAAIFGRKVGTFRVFNDEYDITVRLPVEDRTNIEDLFRLRIPNMYGQAVPLSTLGDFTYAGGLGTIKRVNRNTAVTVTARAEGRLDNDVLKDVKERIKTAIADGRISLGDGTNITYAGKDEEQQKASRFLMKAFIFALLLIVLILVMQFNTLSVPLIIMTTVILSLVGVLTGLLVLQMPFGVIMTGIGVISLAGVVVNNAIVLLDYTRQLQRRGMDVISAALEAGMTRLRPVLLTATTTIFGLIPMATGVSFDFHKMQMAWRSEASQWWASMAIAVIFGLAFATVLTLVVVPTLYVTIHRRWARHGFGGLSKVEAGEGPQLEDY